MINSEPLLKNIKSYQTTPLSPSDKPHNNKSSFISNSSHKAMVVDLCNMGFDIEMIELCFCYFKIDSIEQIINYLTKEDDIWQHDYIEGENKICLICKEYSDHFNMKVNRDRINLDNIINLRNSNLNIDLNRISKISSNSHFSSNPNSSKDISILVKNKSENLLENLECQVCCCEVPASECFSQTCGHFFCNECWRDYLEEKISNSNVINLTCMMKDCRNIISEKQIQKLLKDQTELLEKYQKFKLNKLIVTSSDKKFCPEINCGGYAQKTLDKFVVCNNGHKFCFDCLKKWHGKKKCEDLIDQDFENWKKGKMIKKCPSCKFWTEKNEGCNHMTCRSCSYQWCWICEGVYTYNHYSATGACSGLQYSK